MKITKRTALANIAAAFLAGSNGAFAALKNGTSRASETEPIACRHSEVPAELKEALQRYTAVSKAFMNGDPTLIQAAYSHCSDVTIFGDFGGYEHGWKEQVERRFEWAAARFRGGDTESENISLIFTPELACSVDLEHERSRLAGVEGTVPVDLRVTTVYRREGQQWKIVHRHADPLVKIQDAASVIRK